MYNVIVFRYDDGMKKWPRPGEEVVYRSHPDADPEWGVVTDLSGRGVFVRYSNQPEGAKGKLTPVENLEYFVKECDGICMTGYDVSVPHGGIAYPHPDCPVHGDDWSPYNNEWSRQYITDHPERFGNE